MKERGLTEEDAYGPAAQGGDERQPARGGSRAERGHRGGTVEMKIIAVGFIPLLDCASLVVAAERGFAAEEGLELTLVRETSWANIRDRLIVGHFDAAHMLGPMTVASTLGIGHVKCPVDRAVCARARRQRDHRIAAPVGADGRSRAPSARRLHASAQAPR